MRPGQQQNKQRMRGRGGRKGGPNPMSRSFESNGPDVKIRGTAQHIADKYTTLARDAAAAGDRVMAENYLQHAEHYGRIVAAAMGQFQPSQPERDYSDYDEEDGEEGQGPEMGQPFAGGSERQERPQNGFSGERPQHADRQPHGDRQGGGERHGGERQGFRDGQNARGERRDNRENRGERPFGPRDGQNRDGFARDHRDGQNRDDRRERDNRDNRQPGTGPQPFVQGPDLDMDGAAPRGDGARFEGSRRENRRDRQRLNDRSGERRFEERFGRQRPGGEDRDEPAAERPDRPAETIAARTPEPEVPVEAATVDAPLGVDGEGKASEARGRGRRRRETVEGGDAPTPAAAPVPAEPAAAEPAAAAPEPAAEAAHAPTRRRAPKVVADAPVAAEDEAAPKRRAPKPRRKKDEAEGDTDRAPALLTSDN